MNVFIILYIRSVFERSIMNRLYKHGSFLGRALLVLALVTLGLAIYGSFGNKEFLDKVQSSTQPSP
jgi:hypothetical protein